MEKVDKEFNKILEEEGVIGVLRVCFKEIRELKREIITLKIPKIY